MFIWLIWLKVVPLGPKMQMENVCCQLLLELNMNSSSADTTQKKDPLLSSMFSRFCPLLVVTFYILSLLFPDILCITDGRPSNNVEHIHEFKKLRIKKITTMKQIKDPHKFSNLEHNYRWQKNANKQHEMKTKRIIVRNKTVSPTNDTNWSSICFALYF